MEQKKVSSDLESGTPGRKLLGRDVVVLCNYSEAFRGELYADETPKTLFNRVRKCQRQHWLSKVAYMWFETSAGVEMLDYKESNSDETLEKILWNDMRYVPKVTKVFISCCANTIRRSKGRYYTAKYIFQTDRTGKTDVILDSNEPVLYSAKSFAEAREWAISREERLAESGEL